MRLLAVCLLLVGCGSTAGPAASDDSPTAPSSAPSSASTAASSPPELSRPASSGLSPTTTRGPVERRGTTIIVADSPYGPMLYDASGQAIYLFDAEQSTRPECYDDCAAAWPPVLTVGAPQAEGRVRAELLGTARRRDGTTQVTYAGHPLYFYAHEDPGQVLCHDVDEYGGTWLVVTPEGTPAPA